MTSIADEAVSTILVSCKQTRFHIESPNYREVGMGKGPEGFTGVGPEKICG